MQIVMFLASVVWLCDAFMLNVVMSEMKSLWSSSEISIVRVDQASLRIACFASAKRMLRLAMMGQNTSQHHGLGS